MDIPAKQVPRLVDFGRKLVTIWCPKYKNNAQMKKGKRLLALKAVRSIAHQRGLVIFGKTVASAPLCNKHLWLLSVRLEFLTEAVDVFFHETRIINVL